jgi:hypothetical protein
MLLGMWDSPSGTILFYANWVVPFKSGIFPPLRRTLLGIPLAIG